jgi:predicted transcriptional regulator
MGIKLFDSELKVMDVIWRKGDLPAKRIAEILGTAIGWNKNTTYTVIKKCVDKGAIERREPNFVCRALISREQAQETELDELIGKLFDGSADMLFAALMNQKKLPGHVIERLKGAAGGRLKEGGE